MMDLAQNIFTNQDTNPQESYDFSKQLNNLFNQVELLKEMDIKVAIYGNGIIGNIVLDKLKKNVVVIADKQDEIQKNSVPLCNPEELINFDFDFIIICVLGREVEIKNYLISTLKFEAQKILAFDIATDITISYPILETEKEELKKLQNKYKGKRCFILGNGPSLNDIELDLLQDEYTFGSNFIYRKTETTDFRPTFYIAEDRFVFQTKGFYENIDAYKCNTLFFPAKYKRKINHSKNNNIFFELNTELYNREINSSQELKFAIDFSKGAYSYFSVIYLQLQLAYFLGFKDIYLLGVDFNYPKVNKDDKHIHQVSNEEMLSGQLLGFQKAKNIFEADKRSIKNATKGSKLEVFEKIDFNSLMKENNAKN